MGNIHYQSKLIIHLHKNGGVEWKANQILIVF